MKIFHYCDYQSHHHQQQQLLLISDKTNKSTRYSKLQSFPSQQQHPNHCDNKSIIQKFKEFRPKSYLSHHPDVVNFGKNESILGRADCQVLVARVQRQVNYLALEVEGHCIVFDNLLGGPDASYPRHLIVQS